MSTWSHLAHWILNNRRLLLLGIAALTIFLGYWASRITTDHTTGHFLAKTSRIAQDFERASEVFGQSQTILYLVFDGADPYEPGFLQALDALTQAVAGYEGVEHVLSLTNVPFLLRQDNAIAAQPLYQPDVPFETVRERLEGQPFLRGLLLSNDGSTTVMLVQIDAVFNNQPARVALVEQIEAAASRLPGTLALAGFPYLRTQYARRISREAPLFTLLALLIALIILFLTFGALRAVVLPTVIVGLGLVWTVGLIALFGHQLNIVTSMLPALLVIIGMATVIHLCTKFLDQYHAGHDQRAALAETIRTVGLATFLTCLTTAIGFGVLVISGSRLLVTFGKFAAAGIMLLFVLAIVLTPIAFLTYRAPARNTTPLARHERLTRFFDRVARLTRHRAPAILALGGLLLAAGIVGITRISSDIYVFSDFNDDDPLRRHLAVFEKHFGGVVPMEVVIEAQKPGQFRSLTNLRRIERLQGALNDLEPIARSLAVTDLVKLANQAYFGGHPKTYRLPSSYELPFLQKALQGFVGQNEAGALTRNLPLLVDSTFSMTRVYLGVPDLGTTRMNALADTVRARAAALFPAERFDVFVTGNAIRSTRAGENLVRNLLVSLAVALVVISLLMGLLFRSVRLMIISLLPNVIPLIVVGGAMGFAGILLKPSTALIFSVAFGIAVDSTIHFLAKYRVYRDEGLPKADAVQATLQATGKAILFTGFVLMGGFLVFTLSSFGGTVNMGGLTALTLGMAMAANLLLLPALLYRYGPEAHTPASLSFATNGTTPAQALEMEEERKPG